MRVHTGCSSRFSIHIVSETREDDAIARVKTRSDFEGVEYPQIGLFASFPRRSVINYVA